MCGLLGSTTIYYTVHNDAIIILQTKQKPLHTYLHGLRTPNEGINQRILKFWADVADKNALAVP